MDATHDLLGKGKNGLSFPHVGLRPSNIGEINDGSDHT